MLPSDLPWAFILQYSLITSLLGWRPSLVGFLCYMKAIDGTALIGIWAMLRIAPCSASVQLAHQLSSEVTRWLIAAFVCSQDENDDEQAHSCCVYVQVLQACLGIRLEAIASRLEAIAIRFHLHELRNALTCIVLSGEVSRTSCPGGSACWSLRSLGLVGLTKQEKEPCSKRNQGSFIGTRGSWHRC